MHKKNYYNFIFDSKALSQTILQIIIIIMIMIIIIIIIIITQKKTNKVNKHV